MALSDFDKELGNRIAGILDREYPDIPKQEIANLIGVLPPALSDMFSGKRHFRVEMVYKIARRLGCSVDYLLGNADDPTTDPDMQAAIKALGLSQKAVENVAEIAGMQSNSQIPSSVDAFLRSDVGIGFFACLDKVALEAALLSGYVKAEPVLDYRSEAGRYRGVGLQYAIMQLADYTKQAASSLYNADEIISRAQSASIRDQITAAQLRKQAAAAEASDGEETS